MSPVALAPERPTRRARRSQPRRTSLLAHGEPSVWLAGSALAACLLMVAGFLALVVTRGMATFWPVPIVLLETADGREVLGEVTADEHWRPGPDAFDGLPEDVARRAWQRVAESGEARRRLVRTGNFQETGTHFEWVEEPTVVRESRPEWAYFVERTSWGRVYGIPAAFVIDGEDVANEPERIEELLRRHHPEVLRRLDEREVIEAEVIGDLNARIEEARLALREAELRRGVDSPEWRALDAAHRAIESEAQEGFRVARDRIQALDEENDRYRVRFAITPLDEESHVTVGLAQIVRAAAPNRLGFGERLGLWLSRWWEFLSENPREANSEGGVFPAIFGTVAMTLLMSILAVPLGVLAALYLHEYARQGLAVSAVRIAVNNLAGVPSIVFGVFGLGFFCYVVGASLDQLLFAERLPNPTYGKGGLLWASLTLALLTLPVVIVATEEALAAVPGSMREGSYACGATRWQTIRRIVLPRALPGILTGMILAIARGAGEVAPLMLVGAVKLAPELPVDLGQPPFVFPERSFMHLGFHIYDVGFQSQNSEAAKPMVYTTTLLLITIVVLLNVVAMSIRARLRRRFEAAR